VPISEEAAAIGRQRRIAGRVGVGASGL